MEKAIKSLLGILQKQHIAFGKEIVTFDDSPAVALTVPTGATYAEISLVADATAVATNVARFWVDGSTPTATEGLSRNSLSSWDISGGDNIVNFKIIGVEAAKTHKLNVQYYK